MVEEEIKVIEPSFVDKWFGTAGKPRIISVAVLVMLLIIICFIIYSAIYSIPEGALEKNCVDYIVNQRCDLAWGLYSQCNMMYEVGVAGGYKGTYGITIP